MCDSEIPDVTEAAILGTSKNFFLGKKKENAEMEFVNVL
jgi:hypothetical protein